MNVRVFIAFLLLVSFTGCGHQPEYACTPFFKEAGFAKVTPGMSEQDVRDLLGFPLSHFGPVPESPGSERFKVTWEYTIPASRETPLRFRVFSVEFGADRLVSAKTACEGTWEPSEGCRQSIEAVLQWRRKVGDVVLTRSDGSTGKLRESDPGLYVILFDSDCRSATCRINTGPEWFSSALPELLKNGTVAGVKNLYIGKHPDTYQKRVAALAPVSSGEYYLISTPELCLTVRDLDSRMLLYKAGTLWSVPAIYLQNAGLEADDQKWLIQRLGAE
jgi:hypothetical protein